MSASTRAGTPPRASREIEQLHASMLGEGLRIEDLVDRRALQDLCVSFSDLFGISVRIFSRQGEVLAQAVQERALCEYLRTLRGGYAACRATLASVYAHDPAHPANPHDHGESTVPCFTGAAYRVIPVDYDGRRLGRVVVGPYLPAETRQVPAPLLTVDPGVDPAEARSLLAKMPRARDETIVRIANHLRGVIDLILFSGHRALLTSQMHLASIRESYRELQEQNVKLSESYERLKELDRLKSNFLATVSHELRTPLTSILGYSEMLAEGIGGTLGAEQLEFIQIIREKGDQLLQLIQSLLDQSKIESGTMALRMNDVDLGAVLEQVVTTLAPTAKRAGITLSADVGPTVPVIRGDAVRLRQVFLNLAENAIKFTPIGGRVVLVARADGEVPPDDDLGFVLFATKPTGVVVRVEDTGIGIPSDERVRIFDAFYQIDGSSTRAHGGAGLGLSIVKRLVEMHGGTITVEPNVPAPLRANALGRIATPVGAGSVFTVRFPVPS